VASGGEAEVVEALPAGSYTYLRLDAPADRWLVVTGRAPAVGQAVTWRGYAEREGFASRRLDRTFDRLVFASVEALEE
jgi:hypothetical protein